MLEFVHSTSVQNAAEQSYRFWVVSPGGAKSCLSRYFSTSLEVRTSGTPEPSAQCPKVVEGSEGPGSARFTYFLDFRDGYYPVQLA